MTEGGGTRPRPACGAVLQLKPELAGAHNNLGNLLGDTGRLDEAEACFQRALELEPEYAQAHSNLGLLYWKAGRLDEAEACLRRSSA